MNDEQVDPILDACLEELLSGNRPPDLTARILKAWDALNAPPTVNPNVVLPPKITVTKTGPVRRANRLAPWISVAVAISVVAVGGAIWQVVLRLTTQEASPLGPVAQHSPAPEPQDFEQPLDEDQIRRDEPAAPDTPRVRFDGNIKFPTDPQPHQELAAENIERISDGEIVELIGSTLETAWIDDVEPGARIIGARINGVTWCQRVHQHLLGRLPTTAETDRFTKDQANDRRNRLIARLFNDPESRDEFARHWSSVWTRELIGPGEKQKVNRDRLQQYLRRALVEGKSFDKIASELLTASGSGQPGVEGATGAASFLLAHLDQDQRAIRTSGHVARVFLGQQIACAECHDHPFDESLAQQTFWENNAFFRQLALTQKDGRSELSDVDFLGDGREGDVHFVTPTGLLKVVFPVFSDADPLPRSGLLADGNRRQRLAEFIVRSAKFRRAVVNRCWSEMFTFSLTSYADVMRHHPPEHVELLDQLGEQFAAHNFDLAALVGWLALSEPFAQPSSDLKQTLAVSPHYGGSPLFNRFYERQRVSAATFYDSLAGITEGGNSAAANAGGKLSTPARIGNGTEPKKRRANPELLGPAAEQRMVDPAFQHALRVGPSEGVKRILNSQLDRDDKVKHLFWTLLSRAPDAREDKAIQKCWADQDEADVLNDIWCALVNNGEFVRK